MKKPVNLITPDELAQHFRAAVLMALDKRVFRTYGIKNAGWRDSELVPLFTAIDQHSRAVYARLEKALTEEK